MSWCSWVAQLVKHQLNSAQVMISQFRSSSPASSSVLTVQSLLGILCLCPPTPPLLLVKANHFHLFYFGILLNNPK